MNAAVRQNAGVAIADLEGRVTAGEGAGMVRDTIRGLVNAGEKRILINLTDVSYIDSAGLGELAGAFTTVAKLGGQVKLLNPQSRVNELLHVTRLYTVLVTFMDEAEALKSFDQVS